MAIIIPTDLNDYGRKIYTLALKCFTKDIPPRLSGDVEVLINDGGVDVSSITTEYIKPNGYEGMKISIKTALPNSTYKVLAVSGAGCEDPSGFVHGIKLVVGENHIVVFGIDEDRAPEYVENMNGYFDYFILQINYIKI